MSESAHTPLTKLIKKATWNSGSNYKDEGLKESEIIVLFLLFIYYKYFIMCPRYII